MLTNSNPKTYLLMPAMPTPNGRLHLGHIGGPFLTTDILSRHLRLAGHKTLVISGTDSYDSYVTLQATKDKVTAEEICNQYHGLIADDLQSMQIGIDKFVNPLSIEFAPGYRKWLNLLLEQLVEADVTEVVEESVDFDQENKRYLTGCWLSGQCPVCQASVRGYFCEDCGAHFRPEEVANPQESGTKKQVKNLFLKLPAAYSLEGKGMNATIQQVFSQFVEKNNSLRLTANSEWGLSVGNNYAGDKFFNYPFAYAFALMLGEMAGQLAGTGKNALASDSDVITIAAFGIDNTVPVLGSITGITDGLKQYKSFDYYLVNHFLDLDGSKFSTSRRHAIWVDDVINKLGGSSDIIRLYLASIDVRNQSGNFVSTEFIDYYNQTIKWIDQLVVQRVTNLPVSLTYAAEGGVVVMLEKLLAEQAHYLNPENFQAHNAVLLIDQWLDIARTINFSSESYFWYLKGLVLLVYPFMPRLGQTLWSTLGYAGEPTASQFQAPPELSVKRHLPTNLKKLSYADLETFAGVTS